MHTANFIEAVKSRDASDLHAPIKVGYDAALVSHMGNVAFKTGNRIYWDEKKGPSKRKRQMNSLRPPIKTVGNCRLYNKTGSIV